VTGGETRTASVREALAAVGEDASVVLVHDAARPLLPDEVVERVLAPLAEGYDGVVPALPVADTLKRVRGNEVLDTVEREGLVAAQTPQAFLPDSLRRALADPGISASDCAAAVEASGGRIAWVAGDPRLVKVTGPADLELVASWL
jgi:2-C-methyl-D-erythritol 4-phosphate cytidylyltransferase